MAANQADIDAARIAKSKSKDQRVKDMANHMINDHLANNRKIRQLDVKPSESEASRDIRKDAKEAKNKLQNTEAANFDKEYIDHEVAFHEQVLKQLDDELIPAAKDKKVKDLLVRTRPTLEQHLAHAKSLQKSLEQSAGQKAGVRGSDSSSGMSSDTNSTSSGDDSMND